MFLTLKLCVLYQQQARRPQSKSVRNVRSVVTKNDLCMELKVLKCKECNKTFTSKIGFERHSQHHTGRYSHFCSICRKGYNNGYNYKLHMRGHEGRGFPCEFCGKVFSSGQMKQYHESEHTGIYRFSCETCNKGFNAKTQYDKHVASHQMNVWSYSCTRSCFLVD